VGSRNSIAATLVRAVITSAAASAASAAALAILGAREGRGALRPLHASGHWLQGGRNAARNQPTFVRTGVGLTTHHLATLFWSLLMEKALGPRKRTLPELAVTGALTSVLAAAVDYLVMPRRLSPGWELALTRKSMAGAFSAMAAGLAAGALAARTPAARRATRRITRRR
jgi:hypothetical protein